MKKLLLATALTISTASNAKVSNVEEYCNSMYELAETIMEARQNGMTMKKSKEIIVTTVSDDENLVGIANSLVDWAYSEPQYHSEEMQKYSTNKFAEKAYYGCKQVTQGKNKK